jgi:catechol 2,3-dioxygenase-like lactoylglutathione lyase family enzyme
MLNSSRIISFIPTLDIEKAREFYENKLGLHLRQKIEGSLIFDVNNALIKISQVQELPPSLYTIFGWDVQNIRKEMKLLKSKGIKFKRIKGLVQDEYKIWAAPDGSEVAWFKDPDGNYLSLTEFSK